MTNVNICFPISAGASIARESSLSQPSHFHSSRGSAERGTDHPQQPLNDSKSDLHEAAAALFRFRGGGRVSDEGEMRGEMREEDLVCGRIAVWGWFEALPGCLRSLQSPYSYFSVCEAEFCFSFWVPLVTYCTYESHFRGPTIDKNIY